MLSLITSENIIENHYLLGVSRVDFYEVIADLAPHRILEFIILIVKYRHYFKLTSTGIFLYLDFRKVFLCKVTHKVKHLPLSADLKTCLYCMTSRNVTGTVTCRVGVTLLSHSSADGKLNSPAMLR